MCVMKAVYLFWDMRLAEGRGKVAGSASRRDLLPF
jgi:hypothetical protein